MLFVIVLPRDCGGRVIGDVCINRGTGHMTRSRERTSTSPRRRPIPRPRLPPPVRPRASPSKLSPLHERREARRLPRAEIPLSQLGPRVAPAAAVAFTASSVAFGDIFFLAYRSLASDRRHGCDWSVRGPRMLLSHVS